jgi:hypothetical protein
MICAVILCTAAVFNPGQGHFAVAIWKFLHPAHIVLVDRDLLALFFSQITWLPMPVRLTLSIPRSGWELENLRIMVSTF